MTLSLVQFTLVVEAFPYLGCGGNEHVSNMLPIELVRHIVTYVDVAFTYDGTNHVVTFVHSSAETIAVHLNGSLVLSHEGVALHVRGWFHACNTQQGGGQINESDLTIRLSIGLVV